jgi:hypothetical protein
LPAENCPNADFFGVPGRACQPTGITVGPDGRLWIAENGGNAVVRMDSRINIVTGKVPSVHVRPGQTTLVLEANVAGDVTADGSSGVFLCSSIVHGNVNVQNSTGFGFIGHVSDEWLNCQGGLIEGSVSVANNQAGFAVGEYKINGSLNVSGNYDGRLTSSDDPADPGLRVEGNIIAGNLACADNTPTPPVNEGIANVVTGSESGQCAGL